MCAELRRTYQIVLQPDAKAPQPTKKSPAAKKKVTTLFALPRVPQLSYSSVHFLVRLLIGCKKHLQTHLFVCQAGRTPKAPTPDDSESEPEVRKQLILALIYALP